MITESRWRSLSLYAVVLAVVSFAACSTESADTGYSVGLVTNSSNGLRNVEGFVEGMADLGYIAGENVTYIFAGEPVAGVELTETLAEMVDAGVDLIFTAGTPTGVAASQATQESDVPVVFGVIADPILAGVVDYLAEPGGNMTGVMLDHDQSRRLEYLVEIGEDMHRILVPFNPDDTAASGAVAQISRIAPEMGIDLALHEARTADDVVALLADFPEDLDAVFLVPDSVVNAHLAEIVAVAESYGLPTSGPSIAQVEGGALMAYGFVHFDAGAQAARIAAQVLQGADPGSLPIENTESFLAINLATAEAIGLEISDEILLRADVILRAEDVE